MRLIDADAIVMHMADWQLSACSDQCDTIEEAIDAVTSAPTIDAVQVVRCKDCFLYGECKAAEWYGENGNGYCSIGNRRKDDE